MAISQRTLTITAATGAGCACYLAVPESGGGPGLLLLMDHGSTGDHVKHLANLYAEEGWLVAAPLQSTDRVIDADFAAAACAALGTCKELRGACGVIGHGSGGRLALLLAAHTPDLRCVVAYDPALRVGDGALLAELKAAALVHVGAADNSACAALLAELAGNTAIEVRQYAARAGFDDANGASFDRSAHWLAKSRTLALLRRQLGPVYDLAELWEAHLYSEFADRNVDVSMATMVDEPYVFVVPTVTGGTGKKDLHRWYSNHFHFQNPPDTTIIPISRTIGVDRLVDEFIFCFTHDRVMDWILPGVAPTGRYVEVPMTAVVNFRGEKLYHEHIAWDQATVLVQTGLIDATGLPVTGIEQSKAMQDEALPRNRLIAGWN